MCVFTAVATIRYETNHVHDLPQLHATYTIAAFTVLYVEKTWVQKKEQIYIVMFLSCILCNHYHQEPFDLVEANAGNEDDDNLKTGPSF